MGAPEAVHPQPEGPDLGPAYGWSQIVGRTWRAMAAALAVVFLLAWAPAALAAPEEKESKWGTLDVHFRVYFMETAFERQRSQQSLAVGGWLSYLTPSWHGLSAGGTFYTSQPAFLDDTERGGNGLLTAQQDGFSVLGEAYLQGRWQGLTLRAGRQIVETPMVNSDDFRMVPVTLEAFSAYYKLSKQWSFTAVQFSGIKGWSDTTFQPMSKYAGLGGDEQVTTAGAVWTPGQEATVQAWAYWCHNFMNMGFAQIDYDWQLSGGFDLALSAQGLYQQETGDALGGSITAGMGGIMGVLGWQGWGLTLGGTSALPDHDVVNPWGSYPGYTSIMELDNDRAGEDTLLLGLSYDFARLGVKGLTLANLNTFSQTPDSGAHASPNQTEHDLTLIYVIPQGVMKNLAVKMRWAFVNQDDDFGGEDYQEFRLVLNFPLSILP